MKINLFQKVLIAAALLVIFSYTFGYDYLYRAVRETYMRGDSGSTIDDGKYFPAHTLPQGHPIPWKKAADYNRKPLPSTLKENLTETNTAAFLVIKNGELVHEQYWDDYHATSQTNSFSMAKAVTVLLVGKAVEEKIIKSISQPYADFFSEYAADPLGKKLTLEHLAKMEAGLDWQEDYKNPLKPNAKAYYGNSLAAAVDGRDFVKPPGTHFEYQSGATQLLGFALRKSIAKTVTEYASEKLWKPLGMQHKATWNTDQYGMEKTFCCINSNPQDFAKLGQLFLNNGVFAGKQIINTAFLELMRTPTRLSNHAYGMGLWINYDAVLKHYYFWGLYGQYIIIVPEKQIVIVRTGMYKDQSLDKKGRPVQVEFLVNEVAKTTFF